MASATSRGSTPNSHPQLLDRLAAWQQEFDAYYHWIAAGSRPVTTPRTVRATYAPTLILHGRRDRSVPVDLAERMHAGIPGSRMELFRGSHMFFLFAERQQFLDQAGRFLAG
jgi:pimeloyl-ACP methyl ester carboxylesterase